MRYLIKCILVATCILICFSCVNSQDSKNLIKINLATKIKTLMIKDLIKDIKIIRLETSKECTIQEYSKIITTENNIYILDRRNSVIYSFNKEGKYLEKLCTLGRGPQDYLELSDFIVSQETIVVLDRIEKKILTYDLNFNFIEKNKFIGASYFEIDNYNNFYTYNECLREKAVSFINSEGEVIKSYLNQPKYCQYMSFDSEQPLNKFNNMILLTKWFDYNVYSITKDSCSIRYTFDFGNNNYDKDMFDTQEASVFMNNIYKNKKCVISIDNYIETQNWISFYANSGILYNKNTKQSIILSNLDIPYNILSTPKCYSNGYYTSTISASNIINCWSKTASMDKYKEFQFLTKFKNEKVNENDNDWIIQFKLKNNE